MQRLIDANALLEQPLDIVNYPSHEVKEAPTVLTIPDNPTNGDMIKVLFPNVKIVDNGFTIEWRENGKFITTFDGNDWWNAPYKAENDRCN